MAVWNLGSVNIDFVYAVPQLPAPGETLAAQQLTTGLGGKGANQSVAAARGGSRVHHIGAVGPDGAWARERLAEYRVDTSSVRQIDMPTGHAIIFVAEDGENSIVTFEGANGAQSQADIVETLMGAHEGDLLLLQNETSHQQDAARIGWERKMRVVYSAAPFSVDAVEAVMPYVTLLVMNEVEMAQLTDALDLTIDTLPVGEVLVTKGRDGAEWACIETGERIAVPSISVKPLDTTGAGDTFVGYFAAGLDQGLDIRGALERANAAAALKVTRPGTADAIPGLSEVKKFLSEIA